MLAIVDYGVGNLYSLASSLKAIGVEAVIADSSRQLQQASHIILPGVGAFADAAQKLNMSGMRNVLLEEVGRGKPLLGICLGMQMLFDKSLEYGEHEGLGLIPGVVSPLADDIAPGLKTPHIGWNRLEVLRPDPLFRYFQSGLHVYYVHSFYAKGCAAHTLAVSDYSIPVTGVVKNANVYGVQFHPEKSGRAGLSLLRAFAEMEEGTW